MKKKLTAALLAILLAAGMAAGPDGSMAVRAEGVVEKTTESGISYCVEEDGGVTILRYAGGMETLEIPEQIDGKAVTGIGDNAFYGCIGLKKVVIPPGVESIGNSAFYGCVNLSGMELPSGLASIGDNAFERCWHLYRLVIPASVTSIGKNAFYCDLRNISVEDGNRVYDSRGNCQAIIHTESNTLVAGTACTTIPADVTGIGDYAFASSTFLRNLTIPAGVTSIGDGAFYGCYMEFDGLTIPASVERIGRDAFAGCYELTYVYYDGSREQWKGIDIGERNYALAAARIYYDSFIPEQGEVIKANGSAYKVEDVEERTVSLISGSKKAPKATIGSVDIGNREYIVTSIGKNAFANCKKLKNVTICGGVTSIASGAFSNCSGLKTVEFSGKSAIQSIARSAFRGTSVNKVIVTKQINKDKGFLKKIKAAGINVESLSVFRPNLVPPKYEKSAG